VEPTVRVGWEGQDADDGAGVEWAVDVWEGFLAGHAVADEVYRVVADFGLHLGGINLQQHEVGAAAIERVGGQQDLRGVGAVDEAFAVQRRGAVGAGGLGLLPLGAVYDVVEVGHLVALFLRWRCLLRRYILYSRSGRDCITAPYFYAVVPFATRRQRQLSDLPPVSARLAEQDRGAL